VCERVDDGGVDAPLLDAVGNDGPWSGSGVPPRIVVTSFITSAPREAVDLVANGSSTAILFSPFPPIPA
jgi:hypothetical protein